MKPLVARGAAALCWTLSLVSSRTVAQEESFLRGDLNQDRVLDLSDAISGLFYLFGQPSRVVCEKAADVNDSGQVDVSDPVYELQYLFTNGPQPPAPFPRCGLDPTPDGLACATSPCATGEGTIVISEILASNSESLRDADGDSSDWIELHLLDSAPEATLDLGGWFLTGNPSLLTQWQFPPGVVIERGGFLLVFASGKHRAVAGEELHTSFRLGSSGEYLALVAPDGLTIVDEFDPYPEQLTDISYGRAQATTTLVREGGTVLYHVPVAGDAALGTSWTAPGFAAAGWRSGKVGLGFSGIATEGFEVTYVKANVAVTDLSVAEEVLNNPARQSQVTTETAAVIDYFNTGSSGNFPNDYPFPGIAFDDVEDFVVLATGTVLIPQAGAWSFGVNSDDGFGLDLVGGGQTYSMSYPAPRGPADTIQTFNIAQAGPHELTLVFYERGGGSELELFAAQGSHSAFNPAEFHLVGDTAAGGLGLLGFSSAIQTDLGGQMRGINASLWARAAFNVADPSAFGGLVLRMRYEDGFVAYLNGTEVARRNAPLTLSWSSVATSDRPVELAPLVEEINLTSQLGLLQTGSNVLAIHGLNDSASNGDFLLLPELIAAGRIGELQYMTTPTPGAFNVSGAVDFVRRIDFSVDHGFYDSPFTLALGTATAGAQIRYTLNGATPTAQSGTIYSGPLTISRTTVLRAAGFKAGYLDSTLATRSYVFVDDVKLQSPSGQAPGAGWPTGVVNGQILDYGMDPDVVNDPRWSGQVRAALLSIPSISLVTDLANLFSASTGIYVHAGNDGRAWERRASAELIYPDGSEGFAVEAGLRIRGAFSRSGDNPKHSFRLFFRKEYTGKLKYALFGGEGTDEFDKVDLRTSQNYSWAFSGSNQNTFMREVFSRDVMKDMRQPYTRSRYYHLYLNGQYWGLYQTEERADSDYAAAYLGGKSSDYDVIKNDSSGSRVLQATDGTIAAYRRLYDAAVAGFGTDQAYLKVQGLKLDGSIDPAGERLLDPQNLMDYMVCTYYTGDPDAPVSAWGMISNNVFAIYDRVKPAGFLWFRHDAEHSLGANGGLNEARLLTDPAVRAVGQQWGHFNPAWLHLRLGAHPEYRMEFADRVNRCFSNGGILTPDANIARWLDRAGQIDLAVIGASARWGDSKINPPRTKEHWRAEVDGMVSSYFPQRTAIVLAQMRSVGMFPPEAIVSFNRQGGEVPSGFRLLMTQKSGNPGTIYYTRDGSDPRLWGGGLSPTAHAYSDDTTTLPLIGRGAVWRFKDDGSNQGTSWRALGFADGSWSQGPAQLGYGDGDEATTVQFGLDANNKYATTYFRHEFVVADASQVIDLALGLVRDDGAVVYLNGVEVVRSNLPGGSIDYLTFASGPGVPVGGADESAFQAYSIDPGLLVDGDNVVAVEIHQADGTSSDISFDLELTALTAGGAASPVLIDGTTTVRARVRDGAGWGAVTEARFTVGIEGLVINEVMASNHVTLQDPAEPGEFPDWIELYNGAGVAVDLGGMFLTDDPTRLTKWQIAPGVTLGSGQRLIIFADDDGTQGPLHTSFQLSQSGETLTLVDSDGATVIDSVVFDTQMDDISYGRYPDGGGAWGFHTAATPGAANQPHLP